MMTARIAHFASLCLALSAVACTGEPSTSFPPTGGGGGEDELDGPDFTLTEPVDGQHFGVTEAVWVRGTLNEIVPSTSELGLLVELDGVPVEDIDLLWRNYGFSGSFVPPSGVQELSVTMSDEYGSTTHSVQIVVDGNQPPTTPVVAITPAHPVTGQELFMGLVEVSTDPESQRISYDIQWTRDGQLQDQYRGLEIVPEGVIRRGERWGVQVVASDGELLSDVAEAFVEVEGAGPVIDVTISPDPAFVDSELSCVWSIEEPDGLPLTNESARWLVNGADVGDAGAPLSGAFTRGDTVDCVVSATSSAEVTQVASLTVSNSAPVTSSVSLLGAPATELDTLECGGSASDADGDSVSLVAVWFVDGTSVGSGLTLDGDDFDRDQEVWCELAGTDGVATGVGLESAHTTILNSAPTTPSVSINPAAAVPGDTLTCNVDLASTDDDPNDTLTATYTWAVDGAVDSSATGGTYDTSALLGGELVSCTYEVSDGTASASDAASVVVGSRLEGGLLVSDADATLEGTSSRAYFGSANADLGDVDGDGVPDLLVAAYGSASSRGAVFLFSGATLSGTQSDTDATWWWQGDAAGDYLGAERGFVAAGDLDGDGRGDAWLAAWRATVDGDTEAGAAYLLLSGDSASWTAGASVSTDAALVLRGDSASDRMGTALTAMDINGDGVNDLLAGAPLDDGAATNAGEIAVLLTPSSGPMSGQLTASDADYTLTGSARTDRLGYFGLQAVGDVDGDGNDDLFIGAPTATSSNATEAGVGYLLSASAVADGDVETLAMARLDGLAEDDLFGVSAANLGDLDADGADELVVGARLGDADATDGGSAYVFYGGSLSGTVSAGSADVAFGGAADGDRLATWISVGDVDADGVADMVMGSQGAPNGSISLAGTSWLLLGADASSWPASGDIADYAQAWVQGSSSAEYLGRSSAVLGDINGDGADEWVVGADGSSPNAVSRAGSVYIFRGP